MNIELNIKSKIREFYRGSFGISNYEVFFTLQNMEVPEINVSMVLLWKHGAIQGLSGLVARLLAWCWAE